jgi:hypothetical protein
MRVGDRVELIEMPDDPDAIPTGSQGVVEHVNPVDFGKEKFTQVSVKWDNGRTLMLSIPPDRVRIIG